MDVEERNPAGCRLKLLTIIKLKAVGLVADPSPALLMNLVSSPNGATDLTVFILIQ